MRFTKRRRGARAFEASTFTVLKTTAMTTASERENLDTGSLLCKSRLGIVKDPVILSTALRLASANNISFTSSKLQAVYLASFQGFIINFFGGSIFR